MTHGDRILVVAVACLVLLSVPLVSLASGGSHESALVQSARGTTVIDLTRDADYEIEGRRGVVHLRVAAGAVSAVAADCPDHVCVNSGTAAPGRPIVCVPNGVSVTLSGNGGGEGDLDAVSR